MDCRNYMISYDIHMIVNILILRFNVPNKTNSSVKELSTAAATVKRKWRMNLLHKRNGIKRHLDTLKTIHLNE